MSTVRFFAALRMTSAARYSVCRTPGVLTNGSPHPLTPSPLRGQGVRSVSVSPSVPELAQRNAANLHQKLKAVNAARNLVRQLPTLARVSDWIEQAKKLPRVVTH